jgi:hypothetical protein
MPKKRSTPLPVLPASARQRPPDWTPNIFEFLRWIICHPDASATAKLLGITQRLYMDNDTLDNGFASVETLANDLRVTPRTIQRAQDELKKIGFKCEERNGRSNNWSLDKDVVLDAIYANVMARLEKTQKWEALKKPATAEAKPMLAADPEPASAPVGAAPIVVPAIAAEVPTAVAAKQPLGSKENPHRYRGHAKAGEYWLATAGVPIVRLDPGVTGSWEQPHPSRADAKHGEYYMLEGKRFMYPHLDPAIVAAAEAARKTPSAQPANVTTKAPTPPQPATRTNGADYWRDVLSTDDVSDKVQINPDGTVDLLNGYKLMQINDLGGGAAGAERLDQEMRDFRYRPRGGHVLMQIERHLKPAKRQYRNYQQSKREREAKQKRREPFTLNGSHRRSY